MAQVKSFKRRTKSGKIITVKAHARKGGDKQVPATPTKKRSLGAMYEFDPKKKKNVLKPEINKDIQKKRKATAEKNMLKKALGQASPARTGKAITKGIEVSEKKPTGPSHAKKYLGPGIKDKLERMKKLASFTGPGSGTKGKYGHPKSKR